MSEINDEATPAPQAPGPANPSLDTEKVNPASQQHMGQEYLDQKSMTMSPEGLLSRFKELSESNDPVNAILITEVQEMKEYLQSMTMAATISVGLLAVIAVCTAGLARKVYNL